MATQAELAAQLASAEAARAKILAQIAEDGALTGMESPADGKMSWDHAGTLRELDSTIRKLNAQIARTGGGRSRVRFGRTA